ncbi:unnamed protein product [Caretta caretta]
MSTLASTQMQTGFRKGEDSVTHRAICQRSLLMTAAAKNLITGVGGKPTKHRLLPPGLLSPKLSEMEAGPEARSVRNGQHKALGGSTQPSLSQEVVRCNAASQRGKSSGLHQMTSKGKEEFCSNIAC